MAIIKVGDRSQAPSVSPVVNWDFANTRMLPPRLSFSRGSTGVMWDADNQIITNHNLVKDSNDASTSNWSKFGLGTESNTSYTMPDGTTSTYNLREVASSPEYHQFEQYPYALRSRRVVYSLYAKEVSGFSGGNRYLTLGINAGSVGSTQYVAVIFDITNGSVMATRDEGSQIHVASGSVGIGDGWYRLYVIADITTDASMLISTANAATFNVNNYGRATTHTADTNVKFLVWGMQVEDGDAMSAAIETPSQPKRYTQAPMITKAAHEPRFDYDPVTKESKGVLIEKAATNFWSQSNRSWAVYQKPSSSMRDYAPDGTRTAHHFHQTTSGSGYWYWSGGVTGTDFASGSGTMTTSFFIKIYETTTTINCGWPSGYGRVNIYKNDDTYSGENLSVTNNSGASNIRQQYVGNGWYRIAFDSTPPWGVGIEFQLDTNSEVHSRFSLWGFQTESSAGAPTSYIATSGSQVTRAVDHLQYNDFNSIFNTAAPWTIAFNRTVVDPSTLNTNGYVAQIASGWNGFLLVRSSGGTDLGFAVRDYSGYNGSVGSGSSAVTAQVAGSYSPETGLTGAGNGSAFSADELVYIQGDWNELYLGGTGSSAERMNGWLKWISFYQQAMTQDELNVLSEE